MEQAVPLHVGNARHCSAVEPDDSVRAVSIVAVVQPGGRRLTPVGCQYLSLTYFSLSVLAVRGIVFDGNGGRAA